MYLLFINHLLLFTTFFIILIRGRLCLLYWRASLPRLSLHRLDNMSQGNYVHCWELVIQIKFFLLILEMVFYFSIDVKAFLEFDIFIAYLLQWIHKFLLVRHFIGLLSSVTPIWGQFWFIYIMYGTIFYHFLNISIHRVF